jgi:hypothetical protein
MPQTVRASACADAVARGANDPVQRSRREANAVVGAIEGDEQGASTRPPDRDPFVEGRDGLLGQ